MEKSKTMLADLRYNLQHFANENALLRSRIKEMEWRMQKMRERIHELCPLEGKSQK